MAETNVKSETDVESTPENDIDLIQQIEEMKSGMELEIADMMEPYDFSQPVVPDSDGNYSCSACDKKYRSKNHLKRHISIVHLNIKKYPCPTCGKRFHSSQPLRIHERIHTGYKPCKCEECGKAFSDPSALRGHMRMHNRQLGIMCDICGRYMATENSLRNHRKRHEINGEDESSFQFQCPHCSLNFCSKADLESHFAEHRGARVFSCPDCPRSYKNFQSYQYHRRTHTGEKPFPCKECGAYFRSPNLVRLHSVVHKNPDERPKYHCDDCGKDFSLIKTLNFHRCRGSYPCWVCKTMFASMIDLEAHKMTHTVEELKRHLCKICGRRFSKSSVLRNHKCKMLVVVEFDEQDKAAPKSELQEFEQYEFHIDLCKFICKEGCSDDEMDDETAPIDTDAVTEIAEEHMEHEDAEVQIEEEMDHETTEEEQDTTQISPRTINNEAQEAKEAHEDEEIKLKPAPDDKPTVDSEKNGGVEGHDPAEKINLSGSTWADLNPMCLLDKTCEKCGGNIDKDVIIIDENGTTCATHICQQAKKNVGTKKFIPLRKTLALRSSSPRRKVKGGLKKP